MEEGCKYLLGEQDFSAFRGAGCQSLSPNRNITSAKIIQAGELLVFEVTANAFVLHMVRNIIGSLMEVGLGRRDPSWIGQLIKGRDRTKSAATASPKTASIRYRVFPPLRKTTAAAHRRRSGRSSRGKVSAEVGPAVTSPQERTFIREQKISKIHEQCEGTGETTALAKATEREIHSQQ